jgi:two-component system, NarL family, nitrate/nitrite response regulator NarL
MVGRGVRSTSTRSVLIISEHTLIREGVKVLLNDKPWGIWLERPSIESAIKRRAPNPTLIVVGCRLRRQLIEPFKLLRKTYPHARIACFSPRVHLPRESLVEIFGPVLDGCLLSSSSPDSLRLSLDLIMIGESVLPLSLFQRPLRDGDEGRLAAVERFSSREESVLSMLATGKTNKTIAGELGVSEAAVKVHIRSIIAKIGVANRTQAAIWIEKQQHQLGDSAGQPSAHLDSTNQQDL